MLATPSIEAARTLCAVNDLLTMNVFGSQTAHSVGSFVMKLKIRVFLVKAKTRLILLEYDINIRKK